MSVYVGQSRICRKNRFSRAKLTTIAKAIENMSDYLPGREQRDRAGVLLEMWRSDHQERRFTTWQELAQRIEAGFRENYFYKNEHDLENLNIETVIYRSKVPTTSVGWSETEFFDKLGHPRNKSAFPEKFTSRKLASLLGDEFWRDSDQIKRTLRRRAEQEYLMMNMVKGAMWDAATVAQQLQIGIAVRGTGLLAHMGIESGDPTKAQEFKNKTSKEADLVLCNEMEWSQLGAVVHYDPRVEWSSAKAEQFAALGRIPMINRPFNEYDWEDKLKTIGPRIVKLQQQLGNRFTKVPTAEQLKKVFQDRLKEYMEEDYPYRRGHYAPHTKLVGPYIRLKLRQDVNIVGDHDLFVFTKQDAYGQIRRLPDPVVSQAQEALQRSQTFQAQHGGIWYWVPTTSFNIDIRKKIMGAHGPEGDEPLVYIRPGHLVTAAYYIPGQDCLQSVWDNPAWTKWMSKTHSGKMLLNPPPPESGDDEWSD